MAEITITDPDGDVFRLTPLVSLRKARARQVLRPLHKWRRAAARHGVILSRSDFTSFEGGLCVDSMPAAEWIVAVCGCWEDGGSLAHHVEA
jgi:hypothetical protein